jgi:hypothetical protein
VDRWCCGRHKEVGARSPGIESLGREFYRKPRPAAGWRADDDDDISKLHVSIVQDHYQSLHIKYSKQIFA